MCDVLGLERNFNVVLLILVKLVNFEEVVMRIEETSVLNENCINSAVAISEKIGVNSQETVLWLFLFDLVAFSKVDFLGVQECIDKALESITDFKNRVPIWIHSFFIQKSDAQKTLQYLTNQYNKCLREEKSEMTPEIKIKLTAAFLLNCKKITES